MDKAIAFNLFPKYLREQDDELIHKQRIRTRVFVIAFSVSIAFFITYHSVKQFQKVVTLRAPTIDEVRAIQHENPSCPCSNSITAYGTVRASV